MCHIEKKKQIVSGTFPKKRRVAASRRPCPLQSESDVHKYAGCPTFRILTRNRRDVAACISSPGRRLDAQPDCQLE